MADTPYEFHDIANSWPLHDAKEHDALVASIKRNGLQVPIVRFEGKILDGRNRYNACLAAGMKPSKIKMVDLPSGKCPFEWVENANEHRRHQGEKARKEARAILAAKQSTAKRGNQPAPNVSNETFESAPKTRKQAAEDNGVTVADVNRAKTILSKGDESVANAVTQGKLTIGAATALVLTVPDKEEQAEVVAQGPEAVKEKVKSHKVAPTSREKAAKKEPEKPAATVRVEEDLKVEIPLSVQVNVLLQKNDWRDLLIAVLEARPADDDEVRAEAVLICSNLLNIEKGTMASVAIEHAAEEEEEVVVADPAADTKSLYEMFDPDGRAIVYQTVVELWDKEPKKSKVKATTKRIPLPTFEEVKAECERRQSIIKPEAFWDGQEQNGWKLSNGNPVANWKSALSTWERLERERNPGKYAPTVKKVVEPEPVEDEAVRQARVLKRMEERRAKLKDLPEVPRD